mmetsp:Transcript_59138/g.139207  ORF Transcript_59138/g.139207 Transcript_59138/m.139207 type:complete len:109 (-) Transcript_59138:4018-4344(-)
MPPPAPVTAEATRLEALSKYDVLDTEAEPQFDFIVRLASELTGSPVAVLNLIAEDRVWTKAAVGLPQGRQMIREQALRLPLKPGVHSPIIKRQICAAPPASVVRTASG